MTEDDPHYNLMGALYDLEKQNADPVCLKTIGRVLNQIAEMQTKLSEGVAVTDNTQTLINALARIEELEDQNLELCNKLNDWGMEARAEIDALKAENARLTERAKIARREALECAARLVEENMISANQETLKPFLEHRASWNKTGVYYAKAIRALMEKET